VLLTILYPSFFVTPAACILSRKPYRCLPFRDLTRKPIDSRHCSSSQLDDLQTILFQADLLDKPLNIDKALLRPYVLFPVTALTLRTGHDIYLIGAEFQRTHKVEGLDTPAAWQGGKTDQ
jgi:hypothetical protein